MKLLLLLVLQSTGGQLPATAGRRRHKRPPPKRQNPYSKAEWDRRKRQAGRPPPPLPPPSAPCDTSKLAHGVTIVTTATRDRLWNLKSVCERWRGPLVVAVGAADTDTSSEQVATDAIAACDTSLSAVVMMPIHARDQLPVNQMRNRAWARARTSHVFVLDADFWPGSETYAAVQAALRVLQEDDSALVVPTFALEGRDGARAPTGKKIRATGHASLASLVPRTRDGLLRCIAAKDESFSHDWRGEGQLYWDTVPTTSSVPPIPPAQIRCEPFHHHGSTRFDAWMGALKPQRLQCFLGNFYEPFVVVRNCARTPRFDERYLGYGKNKLEWITSLRAAGHAFYTAPRAFAVHVPHTISEEHRLWASHTAAIPQKRVVDDMFFESLFARELYADSIRRRYILQNRTASRENLIATPFCAAAGAEVEAVELREKRINLLPAVARACLAGDCRASDVSRARWARIDAATRGAPDLTACLMAGMRDPTRRRGDPVRGCSVDTPETAPRLQTRSRLPFHG